MTNTELAQNYGGCLTATELAEFLKIDRRTIIKYADCWGGVEVTPGTWRFFEKRILEVLNAQFNNEAGKISLPGQCNGKGNNAAEDISGRFTKIKKGSLSLGRGNTKKDGERAVQDKYGVFGNR